VSRNDQPGERSGPPNTIAVMVVVSLVIHAALVTAVVVMANPGVAHPPMQRFAISLHHPPIDTSNLPPLAGSREAGPVVAAPQQVIQPPALEVEEAQPEQKEEQKPEPKKEEPKPQPKREEAKPKREEPKPKPKRAETKVISAKSSSAKAEKKPETERETPQQLRERLESSAGVYSASSSVAGKNISRHVAVEGAQGDAGGGAPDLFRNRLVALIGETWSPPRLRPGQVMEAIVEFTIFSPPIDPGAVNQSRDISRVESVELAKSSGNERFDASAIETIKRLRNLPPLPDYIKESRLRVSCRFYFIGE